LVDEAERATTAPVVIYPTEQTKHMLLSIAY
jgi:hypothetical protein